MCAILLTVLMTCTVADAYTQAFVWVQGRKIDAAGSLFTDSHAIVDPYGTGSTCGPTVASQSTLSTACGGPVPLYYAHAKLYGNAYARLKARIPIGLDVLVSVCTDVSNGGVYDCTDHPPETYCRPTQSSTLAQVRLYVPPTAPAAIDVWFKYAPEAQARHMPLCDKNGLPKIIKTSLVRSNAEDGTRLGDVNGDHAVTVTDGVLALRCAAGLASCNRATADMDCNGEVTVTDAVNILRLAAGLSAQVGCTPSWGGTGFGPAPPQHTVQASIKFDLSSEAGVPLATTVTLDGPNGPAVQRMSLDYAHYDGALSGGQHTLTIAPTPGFDVFMHICEGCYDHPLNEFIFTNSVTFAYDGRFVDVSILYFPQGTSVTESGVAWSGTGAFDIVYSRSTDDAILFNSPRQVLGALWNMPVQYLRTVARRWVEPRSAHGYAFMGSKWGGNGVNGTCGAPGHVITPSTHTLDVWNNPFLFPSPVEQIIAAGQDWASKTSAVLVHADAEVAPYDWTPGAFDGNSTVAIVGRNFLFPTVLGMKSLSNIIVGGANGYTQFWDEDGGFLPFNVQGKIFEDDILLSYDTLAAEAVATGDVYPSLQNLYEHEFGHHLGLAHSNASDVMAPCCFDPNQLDQLSDDDIEGIRHLYTPECF